jgi:hypothetical protein
MPNKFSSYANNNFIKELLGDDILDRVVQYVADNLTAEEVYGKSALEDWATDNGFVKE